MKYAVKFHSDNPNPPVGIPLQWPWLSQFVSSENEEQYKSAGWKILTQDEFTQHLAEHQYAFDAYFANRNSPTNSERLLVLDYVEPVFVDLHPSKIDFRRHLKANVVLDKRVTMLRNGRPGVAEYFLGEQKICEIKFEFDVDAYGFMTRRRELLGYVSRDNEIREHFVIYDQTFSPTNPYHARERIRERNDARQLIFDDIKSKLEVFLALRAMASGGNYESVLLMGGAFWESYATKIGAWVNTGTPALKATISAEDAFEFFDYVMPSELSGEPQPMTVRNFVIVRLTY